MIETDLLEAAATLEQLGIPVEEIDNPIPDVFMTWIVASTAELAQSLAGQRDRWDELDPGLRALLQYAETISLDRYIVARRQRYATCAMIDRLLGADTVLVTPDAQRPVVARGRPVADVGRRCRRRGSRSTPTTSTSPATLRSACRSDGTTWACRSACRSSRRVGVTGSLSASRPCWKGHDRGRCRAGDEPFPVP